MKKHTLQFLMTLLLLMVWQGDLMAQVITKYLQKDFGAYANGITHDDTAFIRASHFFNDSINYTGGQTGKLIIESTVYDEVLNSYSNIPANYLVGIQLKKNTSVTIDGEVFTNNLYLLKSLPLLALKSNVNGLTIQTDNTINKPIIKYADSLYFGAFAPPNYTFGIFSVNCNTTNPCVYVAPNPASNVPSINCSTCNCDCDINVAGNQYKAIDTFAIYANNTNNIEYLPPTFLPYGQTNYGTACELGTTFYINGAKNITIKNIEINGNNINLKWGSTWDDTGIQLHHRGILILGDNLIPQNIKIENMYIHHMGLDGIETSSRSNGLTLKNCVFEYNARQGFSWTGGDNVFADSCKFNHTGQAWSNTSTTATRLHSKPGAGIDIEPQTGSYCNNGLFTHCEFENNVGLGINDASVQGNVRTKNFTFSNCKVVDIDDWGIWCRGDDYTFDSCKIYCKVTNIGYGDSAGTETKFLNCEFEDKPYNSVAMQNGLLLEIEAKRALFKNCTFKVNDSNRPLFWLNYYYFNIAKEKKLILDNCTFINNNNGVTLSRISCIFRGKNKFININNSLNSFHSFQSFTSNLEGSDDECNPNELSFEGQVQHFMVSESQGIIDTFDIGKKANQIDNGYANYTIKDNALTLAQNWTNVIIGPKSKYVIKNKGSLYQGGNYWISGNFIADDGSYIGSPAAYYHGIIGANPLFYVSKTCNQNNTSTNPIWCNGLGFGVGGNNAINWNSWYFDPLMPLCIQGGNVGLSSLACTPIVYNNIASGKVFSLLYNHNAPCFGTSNGVTLDIKVKGGTPNYTVSIDGGTGVVNTSIFQFANLASGQHTIKVVDTNCTETFVINLEPEFKYTISKGCYDGTNPAQVNFNSCVNPSITGPSVASFSGNVASLTAVGTYTITAIGSNGAYTTTFYVGDCNNCLPAPNNAQWFAPNSSTSSIFPTGSAPSSPLVLDGVIDVNNISYVYNNPKIYMTKNTELVLKSGASWVSNSSTMKGCGSYWKGIKADGIDRIVIVNNNSTLQDMSEGVLIKNNAFIQAGNSTYKNNATSSIKFENMTQQTNSQVWNNTFTSDATMIPYYGATKPKMGVMILNSDHVTIGDETNIAKGNRFEKMFGGIVVNGTPSILSLLTSNENEIGIYNNKFDLISDYGATINVGSYNNAYAYFNGSAVFVQYGSVPGFNAKTIVKNSAIDLSTPFFTSCDKGVVCNNSRLVGNNLYMKDCVFGIMNANLLQKPYVLNGNRIENTVLGIQCLGNAALSEIKHDTILANGSLVINPGLMGSGYIWNKGIDVQNYNNGASNDISILENKITIDDYAGIGINLQNSGADTKATKNTIDLNYGSTGIIVCGGSTALNGIAATNVNATVMEGNHVNGNSALLGAEREDIAGIMVSNSQNQQLNCNHIQNTRFGVLAQSECLTTADGIKGNTMNNHVLGWVFRHLGTEGTFGNVGTLNDDNNNVFAGSGYNINGKIFKFCDSLQYYTIYTNNLTSNDFGSYSVNNNTVNYCNYGWQGLINPSVYDCPVTLSVLNSNNNGEYNYSLDEALSIIENTKTYSEYPEIAHWLDVRKLFAYLETHYGFRNSNSIISTFYLNELNSLNNIVKGTDEDIIKLVNTVGSQNQTTFMENMAIAEASNSNIVSANMQLLNERTINDIYLKLARFGTEAINEEDSSKIEMLAKQCPYIGGSAVYKARTLWAMIEPTAMYDDIKLCNSIGVYRASNSSANSSGLFTNENDYLKNLQPDYSKKMDAKNEIKVYPNPANQIVNVNYTIAENARFKIIDLLGRVEIETEILSRNNFVSLDVSKLHTGIYVYQISTENEIIKSGKLTIE